MVKVELSDRDATRRLIGSVAPSAIVHSAAMINLGECEKRPAEAARDIVDATNSLAEAVLAEAPDAKVVALSTDQVFSGEGAPFDETATPRPLSLYGKLKLEAEAPILALPRGAVARPALILGRPSTYARSFVGWMVDTLRANKPLTLFTDERRTPVLVDDLVVALFRMVDQDLGGVWHAGGPESLDRVAMGKTVCEVIGFPASTIVPCRIADVDYPAPRPKDTSLMSERLWRAVGHAPQTFRAAIEQNRDAW